MTTGIVLQARMGSQRLPGKILKSMAGDPMLALVIERLKASRTAHMVVLATTDRAGDDPVADLARAMQIELFRGDEEDVLDRYARCSDRFGLTEIVRATGDNPFVDIEELDTLVGFRRTRQLDYACAFPAFGSLLPVGIGVEVMTSGALARSDREGKAPHHREHVNEYIQESPSVFRQAVPETPPEKAGPAMSFTIDTPEQFARAESLLLRYRLEVGARHPTTDWLVAHG